MDLSGKVAIITGGASGIGLATAQELARLGATPVLLDIEAGALETAKQSFDVAVSTHVCDVTDYAAMQALAEQIEATHGGVDILFNNAGIAVSGPVADATHADWRWTIDVDLWGPIHGVEAFLPAIRRRGPGGHVLFTASFAGLVPNQGLGPYCVAKYGVVALAEVLHRELRDENIGVSVLCPMRVATNINQSERNRQSEYAGGVDGSLANAQDESEENDLAGRVIGVEEVGAMVVQAITDKQLYILPHEEAREFVARRFNRIDRAFAHWHE